MRFSDFIERLEKAKQHGEHWMCLCPGHEDVNPSLQVKSTNDGKILLKCFGGCKTEDVVSAMGLKMSDLFEDHGVKKTIAATYDYTDEAGKLLYQSVRYRPKDFRQRQPGNNGDWIYNMQGVQKVLFKLPALKKSTKGVLLCEGEKDCLRLCDLNLTATTNSGGSNNWRGEYAETLRGRHVAVLPDFDAAGDKWTKAVVSSLQGIAASVKVVKLPVKAGQDVSDYLDGDGTRETLIKLIKEAKPFEDGPEYAPLKTTSFARIRESEISWFWKNKFPSGVVTLLAGNGGDGKSFLSVYLASQVSRGRPWPDDSGNAPLGSAILVGDEDSPNSVILPRLKGHDANLNKVRYIRGYSALDDSDDEYLDLSRDLGRLEATLAEMPDCKLLVIDPITQYLGIHNQNDVALVRKSLAPISKLAEEKNIAILAITHFNKKEGDSFITRAMGSGAFVHASRSCWGVVPDKDNDELRCLMPIKNNYCKKPLSMKFKIEDLGGMKGRLDFNQGSFHGRIDDYGKDKTTKTDKAEEWLETYIGTGRVASSQIFEDAKEAGFSKDLMYKAKDKIGARAIKEGGFTGGWYWTTEPGENVPF